jgi:hypothetical protein
MTRLAKLFKRATGVKGRKRAKKRAYRSATMEFKMKLVEREMRSKDAKRERN